jgi:hypothetical protein
MEDQSAVSLFLSLIWLIFFLFSFLMFFSFVGKKINKQKNESSDDLDSLQSGRCKLHSWDRVTVSENYSVLKCSKCGLIAGQRT